MEKQRRRDVRGIVGKIAAVVFAAGFVLSIVPAIRALAEGTIFKIQSAEITEISTGATGSINTYDEQTIVSNVTFHKINDSISYKIVLQNSDNKDHIIESITDDNASEIIDYIYDAHVGETVTAGANLDFLLTAKYATAVTDTSKRAEVSNVKFFVKFTDVEEPEEIDIVVPNTDAETPVVPDTGANTKDSKGAGISLATMIISVVGLTVLALIAVKKHKKYAKIIGVAVVAVSAFGLATTAKAANIETNSFTLTTNYGLYDKLVIKNGDDNVIINYGDKLEDAGEITNPTKPGYIFSGWQDEDGNDIDPTNPIYEDLTIKPKFTAISYKVRFDANGGAGEMADQTFTYDEAANLAANTFTYAGRAYAGWDTEANGSGVHYDDAQSVKNLTTVDNGVVNLYAQWSINPYYINYNANGGEGEMATTNCEYDEDCQLRANAFTKYGYDFAGWKYGDQTFTDGQIVRNLIEQGTITLEAQWTPTEYEIHYDGITDEERFALNNPTTYTIETPAFQLHNPADRKDDDGDTVQVFVGWQETTTYPIIVLPNTNNLGTKTYKAIWGSYPLPRYAITYNLDGGNVATANPTTHDKAESFTLNEPTKTGYTFTGWTGTTIEGSTPVMNYTLPAPHIRDAIEFTAHYRKNTYTIDFDGNGSTSGSTASMNMNYDEAANLIANSFERTGYTFAGWKYNNEDYADGAEVTNLTAEDGGAVTMVAQWEPTQYTIVFHANNENVENPDAMAAQIVTYDIETPLTANAYTWWQHKIVEWTTNENGTGTKYADKATIKNLNANGGEVHLYAKWREIDAALDGRGSMTNKGINTKLKAITTANPDAKNFLHYPNGEPSDEIKASATDLSGTIDPIYAWVDGENIYWWSEDVKPRISTNNSIEYHYYGVGKSTTEGNVNNLEYMDLTGFDTTGIVGARSPFEYTNIRRVDISDWDLSNATDMSYFAYHSNLEDIIFPEHFDVQKVTSLNMAFAGAKLKKLDFRGWKTRDLKSLTNFIQSMPTITEVTFGGDFNTDNVTSMFGMINMNANLATINNINTLNTANVTSMRSMFDSDAAITSLDLSTFDTTALTDMAGMFKNMSGLTSLTLKGSFTAANVTNMESTFYGVKNINTFDLSNLVSKPTNLRQTFAFTGGGVIETIDISNMDLSDVTTIEWTFFNANSGLKTIYTSGSVNPEVATNNTATFQYDTGLVGGANTHTYDVGGISSGVGSRIDDPDNGEPGYFTYKNARYIRYHDNDGDDTNDTANYALMKSHYITTDSANPYHLATALAENKFEYSGHTFLGWATSAADAAAGTVTYADKAAVTEASKTPLELWAVWETSDPTLFQIVQSQANDPSYQVDFTRDAQVSDDANTANGFGVNEWTEKGQPVYYYRGEVTNNNVFWAGFCWQIMRTTYTGGIKLIYNGTLSDGQCSGTTGRLGSIQFQDANTIKNSPASAGYMYGDNVEPIVAMRVSSNSYVFSDSATKEGDIFILNTAENHFIRGTYSAIYSSAIANGYRYFCLDGGSSCSSDKIAYYYNAESSRITYFAFGAYGSVEQMMAEMFDNKHDSNIKTRVETWFGQNITAEQENQLEDAVYCNDRSVISGPFIKPAESSTFSYFGARGRIVALDENNNYNPSLECSNQRDAFTKTDDINGNAKLQYKVGLATADETVLAGFTYVSSGNATKSYLKTSEAWTMTPVEFTSVGSKIACFGATSEEKCPYYFTTDNTKSVRPVVTLMPGLKPTSGTGTVDDPYIMD